MALPLRPQLVPAHLRRAHGDYWAAAATDQAIELAARWGLQLGEALPGGSQSLCLDALRIDGAHVVLKVPAHEEAGRLEAAALAAMPDDATPRVLEHDEGSGVMLLPFLPDSGIPVTVFGAQALVARLHAGPVPAATAVPAPGLVENLTLRVREAHRAYEVEAGLSGRANDVDLACGVIGSLLDTTTTSVLLHGDLQDKNIRVGPGGHASALDPLPCFGDPLFDLALWVVSRRAHAVDLAATTRQLQLGNPSRDRRLGAWVWALAVLEARSTNPMPFSFQTQYVDQFRHLSETV